MTTLIKRNHNLFPALVNDLFDKDFFNFDNGLMKFKSHFHPSVNISETDKEFKIELAAPGLKKEDFKVAVDKGILTISSEKQTEKTEEKKNYWKKEFSYNQFSRSFQLPENTLADKIDAKYENGILNVILPKKEVSVAEPQKEIKVS